MLTVEHIERARKAISGFVSNTPFLHSQTLSDYTGADIYLKFENLQFTGSFKQRGALNKLLQLSQAEKKSGVIAVSAGNHAQGVAYHAGQLGIAATIVMPTITPQIKAKRTEDFGARVILEGEDFAASKDAMEQIRAAENLTLIHPYDDLDVIAGQGTIGLEMAESVPGLEDAVISIGGGGLAAGVGTALRARIPHIRLFGVQADRFPGMLAALNGQAPSADKGRTIAEGIAVRDPGQITRKIIKPLVDEIFLVTEAQLEEAVALLLQIEKTLCEGAGAAGLAAILANKAHFKGRKVGLILCGANIDNRLLISILQRQLVREGRLLRLRVALPDRHGALGQLCTKIGDLGGNINSVAHDRTFVSQDALDAQIDLEIELKDGGTRAAMVSALSQHGYKVLAS